ncbi:hypothetical protein PROFUN_05651 [Planoprotostelium fungivorum]|uniref:Uncharacterized protein n=1 Tax=Planoprotostelium fungivorum TaxID=1890364 RepID=A0A2P6MUF7_9EUKA|nr:hypothetical protein PROFUN_05651 [Planoprotostelium fungivorum]
MKLLVYWYQQFVFVGENYEVYDKSREQKCELVTICMNFAIMVRSGGSLSNCNILRKPSMP